MVDYFLLDSFFDDSGVENFLLAEVTYSDMAEKFIASRVQYLIARCVKGYYFVFERSLVFESETDFEDFIMCYGEELGVPLRKELIKFEVKTD